MPLQKLSIKLRLYLLAIAPLTITLVALALVIFNANNQLAKSESEFATELLVNAEKEKLKNIVDAAYHIIKPIYESGGTKEEGVDLLKRIYFGDDGYIFGYDGNSVRVFSGTSTASLGKSYKDFKDVNGVLLINDLVTAGKKNDLGKGDEFVTYHFPRLGEETPHPKLSYSIFLEKWDLMIGTGVYIDQIETSMAGFIKNTAQAQEGTYNLIAMVGSVVIAISIFTCAFVIRSILLPLNQVSDSIAKLSVGNGDLTQRLEVQDKHETGMLAQNLNNLLSSLHKDMTDVFNIANDIKDETTVLVSQADQVANVSEMQTATIEQVASASQALSRVSQSVREYAHDANNAAKTVNERGQFALQLVKQSSNQMTDLNSEMSNASSVVQNVGADVQNISTILQVIESIAEQTNLLALNAAIEAARAGEQGRGFAVVADEVRNLASKTQGSTEQIQQMITKLQTGSKLAVDAMEKSILRSGAAEKSVSETAHSLSEIAASVDVINQTNTQITNASDQQSTAGADIDHKVIEISGQISQLNEIASYNNAVSEKLLSKAKQLDKIVSKFKL